MYATPIILSRDEQSHEQYMWIIVANPLTSLIETFKFGFLGVGDFQLVPPSYVGVYSGDNALGMVTFNRKCNVVSWM